MDADRVVRVRYFDGQYLRSEDFTDEQSYHVAMRRRHNIAGHSWGIVHGLALRAEGGPPLVEPGLAVDGYGRELVVLQRLPIPALPVPPVGTEAAYDVWLCYDRIGSDQPPEGYAPCGTEGVAYYRWQELPRVQVTEADDAVDPRQPPGVPDGDLAFGPERTAPEQNHPWPVLLGRVSRGSTPGHFTVDMSNRRYAGVVGASVVHPAAVARVDLGRSIPEDQTLFAVRGQENQPKLDISADGVTTTHGTLSVQGELRISTGALELRLPDVGEETTTEVAPWQLRTVRDGDKRELRVVLPEGTNQSFVVGTWSKENKAFTPCLTVTADNTVTVHGTLHVLGKLLADGGVQTQAPSDRAQGLTTATLLSGYAGAAGVAARLYRPQEGSPAVALATVLAADPDLMREVAGQLRTEHAPAAEALTQHLTQTETSPGAEG